MADRPTLTLLRPAETLQEATQTLDASPLITQEELEAYYLEEIQAVRG